MIYNQNNKKMYIKILNKVFLIYISIDKKYYITSDKNIYSN